MSLDQYLKMQKAHYEDRAKQWSLENRNPVVGSYDEHNNWADYDQYLFKNFDTKPLVALEYGCGPARNLIRYHDRFSRIDGVDISEENIVKARVNLNANNITNSNLFVCDGKSIPVKNETYDVIFSVICLQHIACYDIRFDIMKEVHRTLKPNGYFCFQMGFGEKPGFRTANYHDNAVNAKSTNGKHDVRVDNEDFLKNDLINLLNFKNYMSDIRDTGPGDYHSKWIWVQVQK